MCVYATCAIQIVLGGVGEMAPQLRALGDLVEDPGSIPSTYPVAHIICNSALGGIQHPLLDSVDTRHIYVCSHTCRQDTHTHKIK